MPLKSLVISFSLLTFIACPLPDNKEDAGDKKKDAGGSATAYCEEECSQTSDCLDEGYVCTDNRCQIPETTCSQDSDCVPIESGWPYNTRCTSGGNECDDSEVCILVNGEGRCADAPDSIMTCADLSLEDHSWPDIDGNDVTVCADKRYVCQQGACNFQCRSDSDCYTSMPRCDPTSHRCVCTTDPSDSCDTPYSVLNRCNAQTGACQCTNSPDSCAAISPANHCSEKGFCECTIEPNSCANETWGGTVCRKLGDTNSCGCNTDQDCSGGGTDKCYGSYCGCAAASSCSGEIKEHPGTSWICSSK